MADIEHKGWTLFTDEDLDGDGFIRYEHYAVRGDEQKHLHGSSFTSTFFPTQERFAWLVDHDFPRPERGNWFNYEIDELIEKGKHNGAVWNEPSTEASVAEGEDGVDEVFRDLPECDTQT